MYAFNSREKINFSFLTFIVVLLGIVLTTFGTTSSFASSRDISHTQEYKTSLSHLLDVGQVSNYLQADKQQNILSADFNPFNDGQIKLSLDDFASSGELEQDSLEPQVQGCSTLNFAATNSGISSNPSSVTTGDFNGDGRLDLATANLGGVSILLGNGTGGFSAATNFSVGIDSNPFSVTAGDFNGDGRLDLATANSNSKSVSVLLGNGIGGFSKIANFSVGDGNSPTSVITGDFNRDGKLDIATASGNANSGWGGISVLLGNGTGGFSAATNFSTDVGSFPKTVTTGDFNGDGILDLATANSSFSGVVAVLFGNGEGSFGNGFGFSVSSNIQSITTGDFNSDGKLDLAVAGNNSFGAVSVLFGNGAGGFNLPSSFGVGSFPRSVTTGDFNGDGRLDLATANEGSNNVSVLLGNGIGGFGAAANFDADSSPVFITTRDFNSDGKLDIVTANYTSGSISVLLNTCAIICDYSISSTSSSVGASGGTGDFNVTSSDANCVYTAVSNDSFITITSGASGTGNGTVSFTVSANTGAARTGTITAGGKTFTIIQASGCSYTLTPTSINISSNSTAGSFFVNSGTGCNYIVSSNDSFITITSGTSGNGNGTVNYSIAANLGASARTGTITIGGQTFIINQSAPTPACTYALGITSQTFTYTGGSGLIDIITQSGCAYTATNNDSFVTLQKASGTGNGTINFDVAANSIGATRTSTITVQGQIFTVTQSGGKTRKRVRFF